MRQIGKLAHRGLISIAVTMFVPVHTQQLQNIKFSHHPVPVHNLTFCCHSPSRPELFMDYLCVNLYLWKELVLFMVGVIFLQQQLVTAYFLVCVYYYHTWYDTKLT